MRDAEIHHPNPQAAIEFGLLAIASVLHSVVLEDEPMHDIATPANLEEELVRMFLGYLGIREKGKK